MAHVGESEGAGDHQTVDHIAKVQVECWKGGPRVEETEARAPHSNQWSSTSPPPPPPPPPPPST